MKLAIFSITALLLSACVAPGTRLPSNYVMEPNAGIVFFRSQCSRQLAVRLQETGSDAGGWLAFATSTKTVWCEPEPSMHTLSLAAGKYYFNQVTDGASYPDFSEEDSLIFEVQAGSIIYAGDFSVDSSRGVIEKGGSRTMFLRFVFQDNEQAALVEFDSLYPGVRGQYAYRKQLFEKSQ